MNALVDVGTGRKSIPPELVVRRLIYPVRGPHAHRVGKLDLDDVPNLSAAQPVVRYPHVVQEPDPGDFGTDRRNRHVNLYRDRLIGVPVVVGHVLDIHIPNAGRQLRNRSDYERLVVLADGARYQCPGRRDAGVRAVVELYRQRRHPIDLIDVFCLILPRLLRQVRGRRIGATGILSMIVYTARYELHRFVHLHIDVLPGFGVLKSRNAAQSRSFVRIVR